MSNLPPEIQQAIANKAAAYADQQHVHDGDDQHIGYLDGATEWAGMAQGLIDALKQIEQMSDPGDYWLAVSRMKSIASDALAKYKEVSNEGN